VAADIFLDVASGSNVVNRPEFQRLLQSAQNGKINYVLTKAVSRFGRSTEDVLVATRALKERGVEVYFDDQEFGSFNPEAEQLIALYCSVAEGENKSHSEDVRWGLKRHAENGTSKLYNKPCYGYRQNEDGELEIVEEEAVIVRRVYAMYLSGMSIVKIKAALENDNISSPTGKEQWSKHTLDFMLANTKYYGTAVIFKTHTPEYKAKRKVNDGEVNSYAAEGNNDPIIPEELFNRVQEERTPGAMSRSVRMVSKRESPRNIRQKRRNSPIITSIQCVWAERIEPFYYSLYSVIFRRTILFFLKGYSNGRVV
jgi:site-specific DNA recombinase